MHASHYHSKYGKNDRLKKYELLSQSQSYIYLVTYFICHKCRLETLAMRMS